ncbi:MAG: PhnD/SsuA/transferrin family substrate-binding protein [Thermoplasmatota archaeon]
MRTLIVAALLGALLAGCTTDDTDALRLAFVSTDDDADADKDPQRLADWISAETGRDTTIHWVQNTDAVLAALASGQVDAAFVDGAAGWFGWQRFDLDVIAADLNSDGRSHYVAGAVVLANSTYTSMADLAGARSCHTGLLKSAGMFMPLGWMIDNGLVAVQGADDLASIVPTVEAFFSQATIPESGAPYSGYGGALQCLSEDVGDVAFVKDSTVAEYCDPTSDAYRGEHTWCLDPSAYRMLQSFGNVPSHPVMVRNDLPTEARSALTNALLALEDSEAGRDILDDVLETDGLVATNAQDHLGDYGRNLAKVPGIGQYVENKLQS